MPHTDVHSEPVAGCFACKLRSIQFAPSAMPSRGGGARAAEVTATEKRWDRDHAAYRRLVNDGIQPERLDGAGDLEQAAESRREIEMGRLLTPAQRAAVESLDGAA